MRKNEQATKICKYCQTEIPKKAKICPNCRKKQGGKLKWIIIGLIVLIVLCSMVGGDSDSSTGTTTTKSESKTESTKKTTTEATTESEYDKLTKAQQNAYDAAVNYLEYTAFSKEGLIGQLEYEEYETEDATVAVELLEKEEKVDWNEQAYLCAVNYLEYSSFSLDGLKDQLEYEKFTSKQAEYGAEKAYDE